MEVSQMGRKLVLFFGAIAVAVLGWAGTASACGGFFCQQDPVDQTGERIVFTVNDDGTVTALIEILYQGSADDFSWILPIPEAIGAGDLAVPDDGAAIFDELHRTTDVQVRGPARPECSADDAEEAMEDEESAESGVDVFASGEVGPFGFDVIGSDDSTGLLTWLRDNEYEVAPSMEPLIDLYVEEQFAFVAMRLLDGETAESIQPIEITYPGTEPTIPLRLTAVAAQPDFPIWVWVFGDERAVPLNFAEMEIANAEITFFDRSTHDYLFLLADRADAFDGHAFITEYAQPVEASGFGHPWLAAQAETSPYLTRLATVIDPDQMTVDPAFGFDGSLGDVSNERDASDLSGLYWCERTGRGEPGAPSDAIDPTAGTGQVVAFTPEVEIAAAPEGVADVSSEEAAAPIVDDDSRPAAGFTFAAIVFVVLAGMAFALIWLNTQKPKP